MNLGSLPLALFLASIPVAAQSLAAGDLLVNSKQLTGPAGSYAGVLRIDLGTGVTQTLATWDSVASASMGIAYDPYFDTVMASGSQAGVRGLYAVDAFGGLPTLMFASDGYSSVAPTGDGRIYVHPINSSADQIHWFDTTGSLSALLEMDGVTPFTFPNGDPYTDIIFDPVTQSLIAATRSQGGDYCPIGGAPGLSNVWRLPLTAAGDRLRGPTLCATYDISNIGVEWPRGLSRGPEGSFMLGLNGHTTAERSVLRIEPETLSLVEYCGYASSSHTLDGATYSHMLGKTLMLDNFTGALRAFDPFEFSDGLPLAIDSGLGFIGSGFNTRLIEIGPIGPNYGLSPGVPSMSLAAGGFTTFQLDLGAGHANDFYLVAGSSLGWSPGLSFGSTVVPLLADGYTLTTISGANQPPLGSSFGTLDNAGRASTSFTIPAGTNPALAGRVLWHAALIFDLPFEPLAATNPVRLTLVP